MTKLAIELPTPHQPLETTEVATDVSESIVAMYEDTSEATPIVSEPTVIIVTSESTSTIHSPPVMMPETETPSWSPVTRLASSRKYKHLILFFYPLF